MDKLIVTWTDLIWVIVLLAAFYILSLLFQYLLKHSYFSSKTEGKLLRNWAKFRWVTEPVLIFIILFVLILINPILHGLILAAALVFTYQPIKNYIDGRVFIINNKIDIGQTINLNKEDGIIQEIRRLGIFLRTDSGSRFIYYSRLLNAEYTLPGNKSTGSFHQLLLTSKTEQKTSYRNIIELEDKFFACPYLDWSFKPEVIKYKGDSSQYILKVLTNKDANLEYFIQWINENEFDCKDLSAA